jgi:hypothetical protein
VDRTAGYLIHGRWSTVAFRPDTGEIPTAPFDEPTQWLGRVALIPETVRPQGGPAVTLDGRQPEGTSIEAYANRATTPGTACDRIGGFTTVL